METLWKVIVVVFGLGIALAFLVAGFFVPAAFVVLAGIALWIGAVRGRKAGPDTDE